MIGFRHRARSDRPDGWIFVGLLVILVWAPIPLDAKYQWGSSTLEVGVLVLGTAWLVLLALKQVHFPHTFRGAWPALVLFGAWLALLCLQITPLSEGTVLELSRSSFFVDQSMPIGMRLHGTRAVISIAPEVTWAFLIRSLAFAVAFALTLAVVRSRDRLRVLAFTLIGSGLFQAVLGSFLYLEGARYTLFFIGLDQSSAAMGTFVNPDHFAGYLEMTLAVGIGMLIATLHDGGPRTWRQMLRDWVSWWVSPRMLLRLMLVVMVIALVMTRSRGGNSAFFISMLVAGLLGLLLSRHATRATVVLLASLVAIDIFVVSAWFGLEKVVHRLEQTTLTIAAKKKEHRSEQSVQERVYPGLTALNALRDYPYLGSGGGTFYLVFPKYRTKEIEGFYNYAHNDYVQFAVETGLVGLGLVGLLVVSTFVVVLKTQYERQDALARGVAFGVTMGIISLMIHSWVDFNLQRPANALTFVVLLAMGWVAYSVERAHPSR